MGTICLKAENYKKSFDLFSQAIRSFEQYKIETGKNEASFSNCWFNQANLFAAQKAYVHAIQAYMVAIKESPYQILNHLD